MRRTVVRVIVIILVVAAALFALDGASLLVPIASSGTSTMAPTIPECYGWVLAEGFTYRFRDPRRGEIVAIHAAGELGGDVLPDRDARDLALARRVVGVPGDQVVGRRGRVYVNGLKFDDIRTPKFARVDLGDGEYFVLGDNRTASQDSRDFGAVPRNAIFGRVLLVFWPLGDFGTPQSRYAGAPPGPGLCTS